MGEVERLYPEGANPPWMLHHDAAQEYNRWANLIRKGGHLGFPWPALDAMIGPLLPGWLVLIGGRAKGGKSTLMRYVFDSWITEFKKKILFVGTEQNAGILRALWACLRLRVPTEAALDPSHPDFPRVADDVNAGQAKDGLEERAIVIAETAITVDVFTQWARVAYREKCEVLMFDHFHRLEDEGTNQARSRGAAVRHIKNVASKSNMVVIVAAQLKDGEGGNLLGQYEVPGPSSWAETSGLRKECDVAVQAWRPFVPGVTRAQKAEARDDVSKLETIIQPNVMAVRCDAHRYRPQPHRATRLYVNDGELTSWTPGHISGEQTDA
jgi:hypothetical protein